MTITVLGKAIVQGPQKFALVVTGALQVQEDDIPDPGAGIGGGANGPPSPPTQYGDSVALGLSLPLLALAVAGGGCFAFRRRPPAGQQHKPGGLQSRPSFLLPAGWKKLTDPSSGVPYFLNESTGHTQWEPPANVQAAPPPPPPPANVRLPPDWITATDPASGVIYYYNTVTGASSWTPP